MKKYIYFLLSHIVVLALFIACTEDSTVPTTAGTTVADIDGNLYHSVTIGTHTWMVENLKTTHYRNGDAIAVVTDNTAWKSLLTGARCDYYNDATNGTKYGHLYNFFAVIDSRNIAPVGWHVATDAEWTTLTDYVSLHLGTSQSVAKALAATSDWTAYSDLETVGCNLTMNNSTGFSALPCGCRSSEDGKFYGLDTSGYWWSSTQDDSTYAQYSVVTARYRSMYFNFSYVNTLHSINEIYGYFRQQGFSVRCVKD